MATQDTTATLTAEIKTYYDLTLLTRAMPNLIHTQFGQKRNIPGGSGRTIEFRRFGSLAAATTPLTEGTVPSATSMAVTSVTCTVAQYGNYLQGSDLLTLVAIDPIIQEYTEILGENAGDTLDQLTRNVMAAGTNVRYASTAGSRGGVASGMIMNNTEIRKALRTLKAQNARPLENGNYVSVIHPNTEYDIFADTVISDNFQYGLQRGKDNPLFTGELGSWMGISFVESTNAKIQASLGLSGQDVYNSLFMGKDAYGVTEIDGMTLKTYFKPIGSAGTADPLEQIWTLGWKTSYATVILNNAWLCRVEHVVSP